METSTKSSDDRYSFGVDQHSTWSEFSPFEALKLVEERVYKPMVSYPKVPKNLKGLINTLELDGSCERVKRIP